MIADACPVNKRRYATKARANKARKRSFIKHRLVIYKCPMCHDYHMATKLKYRGKPRKHGR